MIPALFRGRAVEGGGNVIPDVVKRHLIEDGKSHLVDRVQSPTVSKVWNKRNSGEGGKKGDKRHRRKVFGIEEGSNVAGIVISGVLILEGLTQPTYICTPAGKWYRGIYLSMV